MNDLLMLIPFVEKNKHMLYWSELSENPNAHYLLEKNQDKID